MGRILDARSRDRSFYPGSPDFEFRAVTDTVFLNHPYARGEHAFILGSIMPDPQSVVLELGGLSGMGVPELETLGRTGLCDLLGGGTWEVGADGRLELTLPAYGAVWLKPVPR